MVRRRADVEMVRRGLVESRTRAQAAIAERRVRAGGAVVETSRRLVDAGEPLEVVGGPPKYVSRGGIKLAAAIERFGIVVRGKRAVDAGSSTGGFTDCLLQGGASEVVAIDVGRNQLHEKLRDNPRVVVREQTNIRGLGPDDIGGVADLVVVDLSFISLRTVAGELLGLLGEGSELVALVKPQFEAGKVEASKVKGVIRDPAIWARTIREVSEAFSERGLEILEVMESPIVGKEGNVEFLLYGRKSSEAKGGTRGGRGGK